jgi:predicted HTH domain antitoxin
MPFDEHLLHKLALDLFEAGALTMAQGAKLAGLSLEAFIELLGEAGVVAVRYLPDDLEIEIKTS